MIFVTGATGLIGSRLVGRLVEAGRRVRCLVLPGDAARGLSGLPVELVRGDVTDLDSLLPGAAGVEAIVHAAALMLPGAPGPIRRVNVEGTANVLRFAERCGIRRLVYLSAVSAAYARRNVYGDSKLQAERLVEAAGLDHTILRLTMVYARGGGHHFQSLVSLARIPLVYPVIGSGETRLRPVFLDDVVAAVRAVLGEPRTYGKLYNVSGATELSFNDLVDRILGRLGKRRLRVHVPFGLCLGAARLLAPLLGSTAFSPAAVVGTQQDAALDHSALASDCGFAPLGLEEGLRRAL